MRDVENERDQLIEEMRTEEKRHAKFKSNL